MKDITSNEMNLEIKAFCEKQFCCRRCILNNKENKGICFLDPDESPTDFMSNDELADANKVIEENYNLIKAKEGISAWKTHK